MLVDSNILIYGIDPNFPELRNWIDSLPDLCMSSLSRIEVLGYHKLIEENRIELLDLISKAKQWSVTDGIIDRAISLRQRRNIDLGHSVIAATALVHNETLATANTADFQWIPGLSLMNPFDIFKKS